MDKNGSLADHQGDLLASGALRSAFRDQSPRLVRLVDAIPLLVWTVSGDGHLVDANSEMHALAGSCEGQRVEDVVPQKLLHPEDRERWLSVWRRAFESGCPYDVEYRIQSAGESSPRWYLEHGVQHASLRGTERWFVAAIRIDKQKLKEEELQQVLQRKEQFFATLLHELRNPLAPIANAIEMLARRADDPASVSGARVIIQRQLRQLTRLVDDLLDVSRIARGNIELRKEHVDLADVVAAAVETARPLMEARGHYLRTGTPSAPLVIEADAARLAQVVTNLLINAAKYTNPGGYISVIVERGEGTAIVRVRDNGIGISRELLPRIFELFAQASPGSDAAMGGLGVGLAVARQLVQLHGGSILVHSEGPGRGSEFAMQLPLPVEVGHR